MTSLLRNLRFGVRMLTRTPGVTLAILLTLALAIGANTAIFTVTDALLLRPFPYRDPSQLVTVEARDKDKEYGTTLIRYETVRDQNRSFASVAVWTKDFLNLTGDGQPLQAPLARVSPGFFSLLGVRPQMGRVFTEEEGRTEGRQVVLLSDGLWRTRYRADPTIIGRTITLDSTAQTVVGVLPRGMQFPFIGPVDIWTPRYFELSLIPPQRLRQGVGYLTMLARLRPGVTLADANSELAVLNQRYRMQNPSAPDANPEMAMAAASLRDLVAGNLRSRIAVLSAAVAFVLLIGCANVASLLLARAVARRKEIAMRTALGASRGIIFRQLLTESLLLALGAGLLGAMIGWGATHAPTRWGSGQFPAGVPLQLNVRVLAFTLLISMLAGVLFGTIPALQSARVDLNATLRNEGGGASQGRSRAGITSLLVVGQVALSLLLLIGAGLFLHSFERLLRVDPGFEAHNLLTMELSISTARYGKPEQQLAFFDDVLRRVSTVPGVRSAATSAAPPLGWVRITPVLPEGQPEVPLGERPFIDIQAISPRWFETMRIPLRAGRAFTSGDLVQSPPVVVVNETFARRFWPNENALGKHVVIGRRPQPAEVVGVAADVKNKGLEETAQPQLYLPFSQLPWSDMYLLVRTELPPQSMAVAIRAQIAAVDRDEPVIKIQTAEDILDNARTQPRLLLVLIGVFAAIALLLAVIGIYGMLSYAVAQRRQEFGIRLALGAERSDLVRLVVRFGLGLTASGLVLGLGAALLLTRFVASLLYQVSTRDLLTFIAAPAVFVCVALLASYLPARRATRANPIEAIR